MMASLSPRRVQASAGFTFVEVLAALLFLAIVVPTIIEGLSLANRASVLAERHAMAGEIAENKMAEFTVNDAWNSPPATQGDCGPGAPGYRWEMKTTDWPVDTVNKMTELDVIVYYTVQGKEYSVQLGTLVVPPTTTTTGGSASPAKS